MQWYRTLGAHGFLIALMLGSGVAFNVAVHTVASRVATPQPYVTAEIVRVWTAGNEMPGTLRSGDLEVLRGSGLFLAAGPFMAGDVELEFRAVSWSSQAAIVSPDFWQIFPIDALHGRLFRPHEIARSSSANPVVISHDLWRARFGGDPATVGTTVQVSGTPSTIVGIAPPRFAYPSGTTQLWTLLPATLSSTAIQHPVIARLNDGIQPGAASRLLTVRGRSGDDASRVFEVQRLHDFDTAAIEPYLGLFKSLGLLLMSLAIGNVVCLMWIHRLTRIRATAVRVAIGARPIDIARVEMGRVALIAVGTIVLAGVFVYVTLLALARSRTQDLAQFTGDVGMLPLVWAGVLALAAAALSVGMSSFMTIRSAHVGNVRAPLVAGLSPFRKRALIVAQLALPLAILPAGILLLSQLIGVLVGGAPLLASDLVAVKVKLPAETYATVEAQANLIDVLLADLGTSRASIEAIAMTNVLPLAGSRTLRTVKDHTKPFDDEWVRSVELRIVSPSLFDAFGARLAGGRLLDRTDSFGRPPSVVVNRSLVSQLFGGSIDSGSRITLGQRPWAVVGVVDPIREAVTAEPSPTVWVSYRQLQGLQMSDDYLLTFWLVFRGRAADATGVVRQTIQSFVPGAVITDGVSLASMAYGDVADRVVYAGIAALSGAMGLFLSLAGLYVLTSSTIHVLQRDLAIRVALGARPRHLIWRCVRDIALAVPVAVALGWGATKVLSHWTAAELLLDAPVSLAAALSLSLGILSTGLIAALWKPVQVGTTISLVTALRTE